MTPIEAYGLLEIKYNLLIGVTRQFQTDDEELADSIQTWTLAGWSLSRIAHEKARCDDFLKQRRDWILAHGLEGKWPDELGHKANPTWLLDKEAHESDDMLMCLAALLALGITKDPYFPEDEIEVWSVLGHFDRGTWRNKKRLKAAHRMWSKGKAKTINLVDLLVKPAPQPQCDRRG